MNLVDVRHSAFGKQMVGLLRTPFLIFAMAWMAWPAFAMNEADWDHWRALAQRRCPSRHVTWVCDGCYLQLTEGFESTLTKAEQGRVAHATEYDRCADEVAGFSCEMSVSLKAYDKLHLMDRFVAYTSKTVKCEESALCSKMPPENVLTVVQP